MTIPLWLSRGPDSRGLYGVGVGGGSQYRSPLGGRGAGWGLQQGTHRGEAAPVLPDDGTEAQEARHHDKRPCEDEDIGGRSEGARGQDAEVAALLHQGPDAHGHDGGPAHLQESPGQGRRPPGVHSRQLQSAHRVPGTYYAPPHAVLQGARDNSLVSTSQRRKSRHREVRTLVRSHTPKQVAGTDFQSEADSQFRTSFFFF